MTFFLSVLLLVLTVAIVLSGDLTAIVIMALIIIVALGLEKLGFWI